MEALLPIEDLPFEIEKGQLKPLGSGLYRCDLYNQNHAICGYAMYDNGTSMYSNEPFWLGYRITDMDACNEVICPHCNEVIYEEDDRYMEDAPVSAPRFYKSLYDEHTASCWYNPANKEKRKVWKKKEAQRFTYGIRNLLIQWEVSRFTVKSKFLGNCSLTINEIINNN